MAEASRQRLIWGAVAAVGRSVLFRLNSGIAWAPSGGKIKRLSTGDVVVPGGRPVTLGFGLSSNKPVPGAADLIGWHSMVITPAMVGCRVAVFTSIEAKDDNGVAKPEQINWRDQVRRDGGIAVITKSPDEAAAAVEQFTPPKAEPDQNRRPT